MPPDKPTTVRPHEFEAADYPQEAPRTRLNMNSLRDVRLKVSADLGSCNMLVRDVLELKRGSVIPLTKLAGEMTDVYVNGMLLARGEVIVINDVLHIRVAEVLGASEQQEP